MRRGEIWKVNLDPTVGAEIGKTRPAVIVSKDNVGILRLKVIVPITEWKEDFASRVWMVPLEPNAENRLTKRSAADTFQVRSVSQQRLVQLLGRLSDTAMEEITNSLGITLEISPLTSLQNTDD